MDFESFSSGWIKKYHGDWGICNNSQPMAYNTFKPCVDQLVYRILTTTEGEIERRVKERVGEYISNFDKSNKESNENN